MALVDTHCHLDFNDYDGERAEILARAGDEGVRAVIVPGIDLASSRAAVDLAERFESVYAAVGVHPNSSLTWDSDSAQQLGDMAQHPKVVAIGEIGLDYYRDRAPKGHQQDVLRQQLELAAESDLPVIIHNRESGEDVLAMLLDWQTELVEAGSRLAERPGVLHSFSDKLEMAQAALEKNFRIGFTGPVTFKNAPDLQAIAAEIPLESTLVETDGPFLSPHPLRGQRNEPARVKLVAEKIAELQGVGFEQAAEMTSANAFNLFKMRVAQ